MNRTRMAATAPARLVCLSALAVAAVLSAWPVSAADRPTAAARQQALQRDRAHCMTLAPGAQANCRREAGAAANARLPPASADDEARYARNAIERCKPLPASDRTACEARMRGQGTTSGSVAGGGMMRELVTRETAPTTPAAPPPR